MQDQELWLLLTVVQQLQEKDYDLLLQLLLG